MKAMKNVGIVVRGWLGTWLLVGAAGMAQGMARPPAQPVPMRFVRAETDPETGAIVIEWLVPDAEVGGALDRVEILILNPQAEPVFGAMQVLGNDCDPVPPGAFGVVLDPASADRSIKNVASAGQGGQWDQEAPGGVLLEQSVSGVAHGNLGIAFYIRPQGWSAGRHLILARAVRKQAQPEPWRNLATLDLADDGVTVISEWYPVKPILRVVGQEEAVTLDDLGSVTLVSYEKRPQEPGVQVQRWAGDPASQHQMVEIFRRELAAADLSDGLLSLPSGFYQFKHNSVSGQPPAGYYGESPIFEVGPAEEVIKVEVELFPAI